MFEVKWIIFWVLLLGFFFLGITGIMLTSMGKIGEKQKQENRQRLAAQAALYLILFTLIQLPSLAVFTLVSFLIFMAIKEIYAAFDRSYPGLRKGSEYYLALSFLPLYPWIAYYSKYAALYFFGIFGLSAILLLILGQRTEKISLNLLLLFFSLAFCLSFNQLAVLRSLPNGVEVCIYLFFLVNMADVTALMAGQIWGRKKLLPKVSPNKTLEGSLGSMISTMLLSWAFCRILGLPLTIAESLLIGALINVLAQAGDLFFSLIKRELKVKDYGTLIPGHGGILDRFDSLLMVLPFFTYYMLDIFLS